MKSDTFIYTVWLIFGILAFLIWVFLYDEPKAKKQVQIIPEHKTEINTHVIRCTAYVNDTCAEYRVYNIVRE